MDIEKKSKIRDISELEVIKENINIQNFFILKSNIVYSAFLFSLFSLTFIFFSVFFMKNKINIIFIFNFISFILWIIISVWLYKKNKKESEREVREEFRIEIEKK